MNQVNTKLKQIPTIATTEHITTAISTPKSTSFFSNKIIYTCLTTFILILMGSALYSYFMQKNDAVELGIQHFENKNYPQAYATLYNSQTAENFNAKAAYCLASIYYNGYGGIAIDNEKALQWFEKAAEQQHSTAQLYTGKIYLQGAEKITKDELKAVKWLGAAAFQEEAAAQFYLGKMHYEGKIMGKIVYTEALNWFEKAAKQQHAEALYYLGNMYWQGQGVSKNAVKAIQYYSAAAEQNYPLAQQTLVQLNEQFHQ